MKVFSKQNGDAGREAEEREEEKHKEQPQKEQQLEEQQLEEEEQHEHGEHGEQHEHEEERQREEEQQQQEKQQQQQEDEDEDEDEDEMVRMNEADAMALLLAPSTPLPSSSPSSPLPSSSSLMPLRQSPLLVRRRPAPTSSPLNSTKGICSVQEDNKLLRLLQGWRFQKHASAHAQQTNVAEAALERLAELQVQERAELRRLLMQRQPRTPLHTYLEEVGCIPFF